MSRVCSGHLSRAYSRTERNVLRTACENSGVRFPRISSRNPPRPRSAGRRAAGFVAAAEDLVQGGLLPPEARAQRARTQRRLEARGHAFGDLRPLEVLLDPRGARALVVVQQPFQDPQVVGIRIEALEVEA